ncbi:thioredoxin family protein [Nevskia sp.]|uniref:thioredoxin family protein n=1 Tax=Nevskia sp. TaxID=1929292 RepID=UPI0025D57DD6|nr:thioredoxin family protein [Nevskia sp.]
MRLMHKLAAFVAGITLSAAALAGPSVGQPAPAFSAVDSNGKTVSLADFKGRTLVLEWSNDGCPFVKKHYGSGNMQALQKAYTAKNVAWLTVISSAPGKQGHVDGAAANKLSVDRGAVPTAVLLDASGAIGRLYDAKTTPQMFVIDTKGVLAYAGGIDSIPTADADDIAKATPYLKLAVDAVLAGQPVLSPATKPYGCSVKYG